MKNGKRLVLVGIRRKSEKGFQVKIHPDYKNHEPAAAQNLSEGSESSVPAELKRVQS